MIVREATGSDCEVIVRMMEAVAEEGSTGAEASVDVQAFAQRFRDTLANPGEGGMWVLDDGGRVVGNATAYQRGPVGVLSFDISLLPEARGQGAGRALLETILEHARSRGAHKVELEVSPDNARAVALYARAGFQVEGLRRGHYRHQDGSLHSTLLMAYLLEEPR